jgi:hypothetical protein
MWGFLFCLEGDLSEKENSVIEYIAALERVNDQLVKTLRFCINLLTEFKSRVHNPKEWQEMLDVFELTLNEAETAREKKTLH